MALRIDLDRRTVTVSPAVLLAGAFRRIGYDRGREERLWIGQAVHRRVVADALAGIAGYEAERGVRFTFPVDDFTATLEGRVDGRFVDEEGRVVVDEVKSLHFAEELPRLTGSPRLERFRLQLSWYLLAVAETEGVEVRGRLVLADIETAATRVTPVELDRDAALADLVERVRDLVEEVRAGRALAEAKAAEAEALSFPFPSVRPGQREISAAVERAARQGEHLLVEAPTGIGKTAAALVPLLKDALSRGRKLFLLTAKTTQQEILTRTLSAVGGATYRVVRLRAKERMCANHVVLCHEEHCPYAREYGAKLEASGLLDQLLSSELLLEPDTVFEASRREEVCPFEVSLELADAADVVVGDYNYAFDPVVSLATLRDPEGLAGALLLVDEVHNLVDRARGYYSPEVSEAELDALAARLGLVAGPTLSDASEAIGVLRELVREAASEVDPESADGTALVSLDLDRLDDVRLGMEALLVRHLAALREGGERVPDDPVVGLYFLFARFHDVARLASPGGRLDPAFDVLASRLPSGSRLSILCKDPSCQLAPVFAGAAAVVGMSATLSPPEFYRDLLGLDPDRTAVLRIPSPFPRENRLVAIASGVDTRYSARSSSVPALARLVADVAEACPGNLLALFPSYRFLDEVLARMPHLPDRRVLRPSDRATELERHAALSALKDRGLPVLLFAVSGGAFAEGVDYPGEMLAGVVVVSPALPQVRFEQERMRLYFEERFEKGFEYAYVVPGMTRVVQSAGRVIRSETDRGVIVLACRRFLMNPYRRYLPRDWYESSTDELSVRDAGPAVRGFFAAAAPPGKGGAGTAPVLPSGAGFPAREPR